MNKFKFILSISLVVLVTTVCEAKGKKKFYVADRKIACAGTYECMQMKGKDKEQWHVYPDSIPGFNYEEGYEYLIQVQPLQTSNTLAGLYDEKYKLVKVISKKKTSYNPALKLDKKKWILQSMYDTKRTLGMHDTGIYIIFDINAGHATGKSSCNGFSGNVKIPGGNKITIGPLSSTKKLCAERNAMTFEKIVLTFLQEFTTYTVEGQTLTLYAPSGDNMVFVSQ
jgi:heat shock protein HslJ